MLEVTPVPAFRDNYIWMLADTAAGIAAVVDPGDARPVRDFLHRQGLRLCAVLATHHHADHTGGIEQLLAGGQVPVYGPAGESIPRRTHALAEGDAIHLEALGLELAVLDVPGHTAGHIALHGHGMAFVGDTLFMAGCGRLFEGTAAQMHASLEKLAKLPPATKVFCAHEYTEANLRFARAVEPANPETAKRAATCRTMREKGLPTVPGSLAVELETNPFLRCHEPAVIEAATTRCGRTPGDAAAVFGVIRGWKDEF